MIILIKIELLTVTAMSDERKRLLPQQDVGSNEQGQSYGGVIGDSNSTFPSSWPPQPSYSPRGQIAAISSPVSLTTTNSGGIEDQFHCHNGGDDSSESARSSNRRAVKVLWMSVVVCLIFMVCEVVGGIWAQSLAIITDAAHLLTDLASMLISIFSIYLATRPASQRMSFGWHRAGGQYKQVVKCTNIIK